MKVIDLLNKRANGEEVPPIFKIRYWKYNSITGNENVDYELFDRLLNEDIYLNDEVEIIKDTPKKDKKIEKFKVKKDNDNNIVLIDYEDKNYIISIVDAIMIDKITEIIDMLNEGDKNE